MALSMFSIKEENKFKEIIYQAKLKLVSAFHHYITHDNRCEDLWADIDMNDTYTQSLSKLSVIHEATYKNSIETINQEYTNLLYSESSTIKIAKNKMDFDKKMIKSWYDHVSAETSKNKNDFINKYSPINSPVLLERIQNFDNTLAQEYKQYSSALLAIDDSFKQTKKQFIIDLKAQLSMPINVFKPTTHTGLLFSAISTALENQKLGSRSAQELRADAIDYIKKNPVIFLRADKSCGELDDYLNRMSCNATKADALMVHVLSRCLNVRINIFEPITEFSNDVVKTAPLILNNEAETEATIDLGLIDEYFYYLGGQEKLQNSQELSCFEGKRKQAPTSEQSVTSYVSNKTPVFFSKPPAEILLDETLNVNSPEWLPSSMRN
tara:strand:+ start:427 stop:1569 length:1143 start_codon:yes stop_codon:yes gene_type:complete